MSPPWRPRADRKLKSTSNAILTPYGSCAAMAESDQRVRSRGQASDRRPMPPGPGRARSHRPRARQECAGRGGRRNRQDDQPGRAHGQLDQTRQVPGREAGGGDFHAQSRRPTCGRVFRSGSRRPPAKRRESRKNGWPTRSSTSSGRFSARSTPSARSLLRERPVEAGVDSDFARA